MSTAHTSPSSVDKALLQFAQHRSEHLEDLCELVRIPSISFDGFPPHEVRRSAEATERLLQRRGFQNVRLLEFPGGHPYVYGERLTAPGKPTLLLYAHHDVQPVGDESVWHSPPFQPTERNGRLFARGAADDKAGIVVHTAALASYLDSGSEPPLNLKILVEGEEEIGSTHLDQFLATYADLLRADAMVLTDTSNFDVGIPSITTSLRGLVSVDLEVTSLRQPVHSGAWGGPLPDAGLALCKILASLSDDRGRMAIPGIYDRVRPVSPLEMQSYNALPHELPRFRDQAGLLDGVSMIGDGGDQQNPWIAIWRQPSLAINAVEVSSRKDARNVINGSAWARVGIRLVPDMDAKETQQALIEHIHRHTPFGVHVKVHAEGASGPWYVEPAHPAFAAASDALTKGFGRQSLYIGCGGSIPFVATMSAGLGGIPALLIGVEDPYTNAHSENESLCIADWESSIRGAIHLYDGLANTLKAKTP
jgi:acetylornithine deacetylase/succinyl-diaminopimelate desuccinylase-like protein